MVAVSTWACRIEKADALNKKTKMALFLMRRFTDLLCATGTELPFALVAAILHRMRPVGPASTAFPTEPAIGPGSPAYFARRCQAPSSALVAFAGRSWVM